MLRFGVFHRLKNALYAPAVSIFNEELSKLLAKLNSSAYASPKEFVPNAFFLEYKHENHYYYGMYINKLATFHEKQCENRSLEAICSALTIFDCPLTRRILQSRISVPIFLHRSEKLLAPTDEDVCILFLRYPKRHSRSVREFAKPISFHPKSLGLTSTVSGIFLNSVSDENEQDMHRLTFFHQAYLIALRIVFPEAYHRLVESNVALAQEDISDSLIHALNLLSETAQMKVNCGMGYFFVIYNLVSLLQHGIREEIRKINSYSEFEQLSQSLAASNDKVVLPPTIFSTNEVDWSQCSIPIYASCLRWSNVGGILENVALSVLTPSPFLSWYGLYLEALKIIDLAMFHAYNDFIAQEKSLKLSPALNALGIITLCLKRFYGRKLIAVTKGEQRELACNLIYLVERDSVAQISRLEKLEEKGTAMTFFSFTSTTKKEAIKQCCLLAVVTFFPQIFEELKKLDWYSKSTPIIAGGSSAGCPMHLVTTEVHHNESKPSLNIDSYIEISSYRLVQMLNELFAKEQSALPKYLRGCVVVVCSQKVELNMSKFTIVRLLAKRQQASIVDKESTDKDEQNNISVDFLSADEFTHGGNGQCDVMQTKPVLLAEVFSKSRSSAMLQACCLVVQCYFLKHIEEFIRYVIINQEKCLIEESRIKRPLAQKGKTENLDNMRDILSEDLKTRMDDKEPFIESTMECIRKSINDYAALTEAIQNLFLFNKKKQRFLRLSATHPDKVDLSSNMSIFRACVQKAARLNLKPLTEKLSIVFTHAEVEKPFTQSKGLKTYKVSLQTIGDKTVIESTTSHHPIKSLMSLYKFLVSESDFCLKHINLEQIRSAIRRKPFVNHSVVQHSSGTNLIGLAGMEKLIRSLTKAQYGYSLKIAIDEDASLSGSRWTASCYFSPNHLFLENGQERATEPLDDEPSVIKYSTYGHLNFSNDRTDSSESLAFIASTTSAESKRQCLWRLYSATVLQVLPELYSEIILKNESEGLITAAEIINEIQNGQNMKLPTVIHCTKVLPISATFSCHLTNLRVAFAMTANFFPVEEVVKQGNRYKATLWKEPGTSRILIMEAESDSQLYAIFKAYENVAAQMDHEQVFAFQKNGDAELFYQKEPKIIDKNVSQKAKPMLELFHRINDSFNYNPLSRVLPESLLEYGLKLQYGIELMIGTQKGDNCWTTMLYGVLNYQPEFGKSSIQESDISLWEREWNVSNQRVVTAVKRIFLAGCTCHTKVNSLKMACIHVMKTALPAFYSVCPALSSWKTPTDFIELIDSDE